MKRRIAFISIATLAVVGVAIYLMYFNGGGASAPRQSAKEQSQTDTQEPLDPNTFNPSDTDYAQKMITLGQQASELSGIEEHQGSNSEVKALAVKLKNQQIDTVGKYQQLFSEIGEEYFELSNYPQVDGHDAYPSYPGMATMVEVTKFRTMTGSEIDSEYIRLMIEHYEGALESVSINDDKIQYKTTKSLMTDSKKSFEESLKELQSLKERV